MLALCLVAYARRMAAKSIFSDEHRAFLHQAYMRQCLQPAECTTALNERFKTSFKLAQVQRFINAHWSARRKAIREKTRAIEKVSDAQLTREHAERTQKVLTKYAEKSDALIEKSLNMALSSGDSRGMAAATAAAKNAIAIYRIVNGLDGVGPRGTPQFNFNFGNIVPTRADAAPAAPAPVEVTASVDDDLDDEDDDEQV